MTSDKNDSKQKPFDQPQAPVRSQKPLVRRSITSDQRQRFRRWSDAIGKLDDSTKSEEGEAWIASAIAILFTPNPTVDPRPTGKGEKE